MLGGRRLGQVADVGVVRLPAVGVVGARAEVDGLVAVAAVDVVVGTLDGDGVGAAAELDLVGRPSADRDGVVATYLPPEPFPTSRVAAVADDDGLVRPLPIVTASVPLPAQTPSEPFPRLTLSLPLPRMTVFEPLPADTPSLPFPSKITTLFRHQRRCSHCPAKPLIQ